MSLDKFLNLAKLSLPSSFRSLASTCFISLKNHIIFPVFAFRELSGITISIVTKEEERREK